MPNLKDLRKRIGSVRSTQQITKAMKMVAAARLRRAQEAAERARPYAAKLTEMFSAVVAGLSEEAHPLLAHREERRLDLVVLSSDRGLCGGYNANLLRQAEAFRREHASQELQLALVGRKSLDHFKHRGVTPMWDNTARRPHDGMIVDGATPELFGIWLEHVLRQTRRRHRDDARLAFVNAWNEWAEGNHLEPDARHGRRFLEAVRTARVRACMPDPTRPAFADIVRATNAAVADGTIVVERARGAAHAEGRLGPGTISVVMPAYNHARFLARALDSLAAQTRLPDELVAVDDGSTDDSVATIRAFARAAPFAVTLVRQANAGAHVALNRGMAMARGDLLALMNSDDAYAPERLSRLGDALDDAHALAFSGVVLVDDDNRPAAWAPVFCPPPRPVPRKCSPSSTSR